VIEHVAERCPLEWRDQAKLISLSQAETRRSKFIRIYHIRNDGSHPVPLRLDNRFEDGIVGRVALNDHRRLNACN
jgi:hypothetical protein